MSLLAVLGQVDAARVVLTPVVALAQSAVKALERRRLERERKEAHRQAIEAFLALSRAETERRHATAREAARLAHQEAEQKVDEAKARLEAATTRTLAEDLNRIFGRSSK